MRAPDSGQRPDFGPDQEHETEEFPAQPSCISGMSEAQRYEYWAALALKYTPGLGNRSWQRLLTGFGSAALAVKNIDNWRDLGIRSDSALAFRSDAWRATSTLRDTAVCVVVICSTARVDSLRIVPII